MATPVFNNLLTWDENGTGHLVELSRATGVAIQTFAGYGAAPLTYALLVEYITAILVNGKEFSTGGIRLIGQDASNGGDWIPEVAIADLNDPIAGTLPVPAGLLVDNQYNVLYVQQVAAGDPSFKIRKWTIFDTAPTTATCTFPAEGIGTGTAAYRPMGTWQEAVSILGCGVAPSGTTAYILTRQYIYAVNVTTGAMTILVDFGGETLMGCGGMAVKSNGSIYVGLVEKVVDTVGIRQEYKVNTYFSDGTLTASKLIARTVPAGYAIGEYSFGPQMDLGNSEGDLWFYLTTDGETPEYEDVDERLRSDIFYSTTPIPPPLMAWNRRVAPGMAGSFKSTGVVNWLDLYR